MGKMHAIVKEETGKGAKYTEADIPEISGSDVLVRVTSTSICGSDLHLYNWDTWSENRIKLPRIMGHEMAGEIVEVGRRVKSLKVGDLVSAETHIFCGRCYACLQGRSEVCLNLKILGFDRDGSFAQFVALPESVVWRNDPGIPREWASIQEPLGNAVDTILAENVTGKSILITGCGPVGLLGIGVARAAGAALIFATDINEYRLNLALQMGANHILNPQKVDVVETILEATGGGGVEMLAEMSGNPAAFVDGLRALTPGGSAALLGLFRDSQIPIDFNKMVILRGIRLFGITGRKIFSTWYTTSRLLSSGRLNLDPVITHRFPLAEFEAGMRLMAEGGCGKIVLFPPD